MPFERKEYALAYTIQVELTGPLDNAIYGTQPWTHSGATTESGQPIRFTKKKDKLYIMILDNFIGSKIKIKEVFIEGKASLLADGTSIRIEQDSDGMVLTFSHQINNIFISVILIQNI